MRFKFGKKSILLKEQEHWKLKKNKTLEIMSLA